MSTALTGLDVGFVSTSALDRRFDLLQNFYVTDLPPATVIPGWPHPNETGVQLIGGAVASDPRR